MGTSRNAGKEERKNKKGEDFLDSKVCKFHLVGFCPEHEDLFMNIKKGPARDFGTCKKTHFEHSKTELQAHPQHSKYQAKFEEELLRHLQNHVERCDAWVKKQEAAAIRESEKVIEEGGNDVARDEIKNLREESAKYLAEAEEMAGKGDTKNSKKTADWAESLKKKADDWENKAKIGPRDICTVCATVIEDLTVPDSVNQYDHGRGKVHIGFALIRKWYKDMQDKVAKRETEPQGDGKDRDRKDRDREGDRGDGRRKAEDDDQKDAARSSDRKRQRDEDDDRESKSNRRDGDDRRRREDEDRNSRRRRDDEDTGRYSDRRGDDGDRRRNSDRDRDDDRTRRGSR